MEDPDQARAPDAEDVIRQALGSFFLEWFLGGPAPRTDSQREALAQLAELLTRQQAEPGYGMLPRAHSLFALTVYDHALGDTLLNLLRRHATQQPAPDVPTSADKTLDALRLFATHAYGELLLGLDTPEFNFYGVSHGPVADAANQAVADDPQLPFEPAASFSDQVMVWRSTGGGGSQGLPQVASSIVGSAFQRIMAHDGQPSLTRLLEELGPVLAEARTLTRGGAANAVGLVSLAGLRLPTGATLHLPNGRVRGARALDHPGIVQRTLEARRVSSVDTSGKVTEVSTAGDVVVEVKVPYKVIIEPFEPSGEARLRDVPRDHTLDDAVSGVRVALLLALGRNCPITVKAWQRSIELFAHGSYGLASDEQLSRVAPAALDQSQVASWQEWIDLVAAAQLVKSGPIVGRLLRAHAERNDAADQLIDAVIVWEALFGTPQEATLRVTACLARLLESPGEARRGLRDRAAKIYDLRSKVVHGAKHREIDIPDAADDALDLATRAVKAVVKEQPHLLKMTSAERSLTLLLT